jgi:glycosyltransferase involved in cell wall biosynthesis
MKSVLTQSYSNIELIIIDDGSTDNTEDVVRETDDPRVRYYFHKQNRGANAARNTGLIHSNGKYIGYIDSDVMSLPSKIRKQVEKMETIDKSTGAVYCKAYGKFGQYLKEVPLPEMEGNLYEELLEHKIIMPTSQLLFRSECFDRCGNWDTDLPCFNEYDICLRIAQEYHFACLPEPLVITIDHDDMSISRNINNRVTGIELFLKKWGSEMRKYHDESVLEMFKQQTLRTSYRNASLWNAKKKNRREAIRMMYQHMTISSHADINLYIAIILLFLNQRLYTIAKKIQYRRRGTRQDKVFFHT